MSRFLRASCAMTAILIAETTGAFAQTVTNLPPITVIGSAPRRAPVADSAETPPQTPLQRTDSSLTLPTVEQATKEINNTPGAVAVVPAEAFKNQHAATVKDMLDYVPGVWAQPKWGEDSRFSIRGSGLSRNFHGRSLQLYMDGIPINQADGYYDFQEIDPSAYRYVEVYRGANALQFGANSLGGAINFVTPSGRNSSPAAASLDTGSFGYRRAQASSGAAYGPFDYFVTGSYQQQNGFRQHSDGESMRGFGNFGYQLTPNVETRFYFNANDIRQRIPGAVTKNVALSDPQAAFQTNVDNNWQRNVNSTRVANKTTFRLDNTTIDVGAFKVDRHLMHPIFQWLDETIDNYGGFGKLTDERMIGNFKNRFVAGVNVLNGKDDNNRYGNDSAPFQAGGGGPNAVKGPLTFSALETSKNTSFYLENSFYFLPTVALVTGTQFLHATRDSRDRFLTDGDQSGRTEFNIWSPKFGLLWDVDPTAQVFANISRSAEVPSFGESNNPVFAGTPVIPFTSIQAQRATTYEIGTRGRRADYTWDLAVYRAEIKNELQCFYSEFQNCNVTNADRTIHQGIEAGFGAAILKSIFASGPNPDRLWVNVAYTLNDFYYRNDATFGNNDLPGAPRHYLRGEVLYKHPSGWSFGPNIEWVPQGYYVDSANTLTTDPYAIWGLKAAFDDGKNFSAYVEGRNLSDKHYIASASIIDRANATLPLFEPGSGRAYYAGMKVKW